MWKRIYLKLKEKGLNPYAPGQHEGQCMERYCVIGESSQVPFFNNRHVGYRLIDIMAFVPLESYVEIESYVKEIKVAMKELAFIRCTGNETPIIADNEKKAYTTSIEYQIIKRLEG